MDISPTEYVYDTIRLDEYGLQARSVGCGDFLVLAPNGKELFFSREAILILAEASNAASR